MAHTVYGFTQDEIDTYVVELVKDLNTVTYKQLLDVLTTLKAGGIEFCLNKDIVKPDDVRKAVSKSEERLKDLKSKLRAIPINKL